MREIFQSLQDCLSRHPTHGKQERKSLLAHVPENLLESDVVKSSEKKGHPESGLLSQKSLGQPLRPFYLQ